LAGRHTRTSLDLPHSTRPGIGLRGFDEINTFSLNRLCLKLSLIDAGPAEDWIRGIGIMSVLIALLAGLVSGAITSVITYFATAAKIRLELAVEYDKELRKDRLCAYLKLWPKLKALAKYSPPEPVSHELVKRTSEDMRDWYFDIGGVYLSRESRGPYFKLKKEMQRIIDDPARQTQVGPIPSELVTTLHDHATKLREALSDDVGTRQEPFLRSRWFRRTHQNSDARATSFEFDDTASGAD
jgi:hypothetical protein